MLSSLEIQVFMPWLSISMTRLPELGTRVKAFDQEGIRPRISLHAVVKGVTYEHKFQIWRYVEWIPECPSCKLVECLVDVRFQ